jgi:CRP/FNR family transcriptional regulator
LAQRIGAVLATTSRRTLVDSCYCHIEDCVLCEAELYSGLSAQQVCEIRGLLSKHNHGAHEVLFREGEPNTHLYLLRQGQLKLTTLTPDGREQIIGLGLPGQLLGFHSMNDTAHTYTAETLTAADVCKIRRPDMIAVLERNPSIMLRVIEILNQELNRAQLLIRLLGQKTSVEKVAAFILSLAPLGLRNGSPTELPLPLSRQEMAELLGLTVETVSRHMSEFRREGILDAPRGHVRIFDVERLQRLAGDLPAHVALRH